MSVKLKNLVLVSILAAATVLSSGPAQADTKKRKAKASPAVAGSARAGTPNWVQYDQGGMYYYSRNEYEKARQYWLTALRMAEQVVPLEAKRGLSITSESNTCNLINHLAMFVSDSKMNPKGAIYGSQGYNGLTTASSSYTDPKRFAYDSMSAHMRMIKQDNQWFDRIMTFAERTVGKDNRCLTSMKGTRAQMSISEENTRFAMSNLEKELNLSRSSVEPKPNNNGLAPNGEYVPPGQTP